MKSIALAILFICALLCSCAPAPSEESIYIEAGERTALAEFLYPTGVTVEEMQSTGLQGLGGNPKSIAVENGHIVGLRLSEARWPNLLALSRLPQLRILWLSHDGLTDTNGIAGLPALEELILDDNALTGLDLRDLPALRKVSVRHNLIPTIPDLGPNVDVNIEGNPAEEILKNPPPAPDSQPQGFVELLPRRDGQLNGPGRLKWGGALLDGRGYYCRGSYQSLTGAAPVALAKIVEADPTVRAEVTVESGVVWIYLQALDGYGYVWAQATPGNPARFTGRMIRGSRLFGAMLQSRDGMATGIRFSVRQI